MAFFLLDTAKRLFRPRRKEKPRAARAREKEKRDPSAKPRDDKKAR